MADESKNKLANDRTEMAEERTDWAEDRTLLAQERTFSAWARTGTSTMAIGLAIACLLPDIDSVWLARSIGIIMVLSSFAIFTVGFFSYRKALQKLEKEGIQGTSIAAIAIITLGLPGSAVLALILIFDEKT